jgi:type IV pilus assembly protein PilN
VTIKVDLLDRPGRRIGFDPIIFFLVLVVIVFVIGFYVFGNTLEKKITEKKKEIAEIDEKIRDLEEKIPKIKELEEINRDLEAQINTIKQLVYDPIRYANLLDELALIIPTNMFVQNISIEPDKQTMTFSGLAVEMGSNKPLESISKFMTNIQKSKYFKDTNLSSTNRTKYNSYDAFSFNIETHYDPDAASR